MPAMLQIPGTAPLSFPYDFSSTIDGVPLGTELHEFTGRKWRRGQQNASSAGIAGSIVQSPVPDANLDELVIAAAAVGARAITVTTGSKALSADEMNGGFIVVEDDAGEGRCYLIEDNPAVSASTAGIVSIAHGIEVALTSATTISVIPHPGKLVVIHASPQTAAIFGNPAAAIATSNFGWYQYKGVSAVLTEGTIFIGLRIRPGENTDGTVAALDFDEAADADQGDIGQVVSVGGTGEHSPVMLSIP